MSEKPKCLDLFCGAGGASMGLSRAGFNVIGVDIEAQRNYPFNMFVMDAVAIPITSADFVWASPPCQRYSRLTKCRGSSEDHPDLIPVIREKLKKWGGPYIIENVGGAPLIDPVMLCGAMFGLMSYRHRFFESNVRLIPPAHPKHLVKTSRAGHWKPGTWASVSGHCSPVAMSRQALGIDWTTRDELAEAIPPAFSEYLGKQIIAHLLEAAA